MSTQHVFFTSAEERSNWITSNADYFTVVRRKNRRVERHEVPTLADAEAKAYDLIRGDANSRWMIYAVKGIYDTWVKSVP